MTLKTIHVQHGSHMGNLCGVQFRQQDLLSLYGLQRGRGELAQHVNSTGTTS